MCPDSFCMVDGTLIPLASKPGHFGEQFFDLDHIRKCWVRANRALRALGGPKAPRGLRAQGDKP